MPATVRRKGKALKIAYKLLGVPQNLAFKKTKEQERIDRALSASESSLVR